MSDSTNTDTIASRLRATASSGSVIPWADDYVHHNAATSGRLRTSTPQSSQYAHDLASDIEAYSRKLSSTPTTNLTAFSEWLRRTPSRSSRPSQSSKSYDDLRSRLTRSQLHMLSLGAASPVISELAAQGRYADIDDLHARIRSVIDSPPRRSWESLDDSPPTYSDVVSVDSAPPSYVSPLSPEGTRSTGRDTPSVDTGTGEQGSNSIRSWVRQGSEADWSPLRRTSIAATRTTPWTWAGLSSGSTSGDTASGTASTHGPYELPATTSIRPIIRSVMSSPGVTRAIELPTSHSDPVYELDATTHPRQIQRYINSSPSTSPGHSTSRVYELPTHTRSAASPRNSRTSAASTGSNASAGTRMDKRRRSRIAKPKSFAGRLSRLLPNRYSTMSTRTSRSSRPSRSTPEGARLTRALGRSSNSSAGSRHAMNFIASPKGLSRAGGRR